MYSQSGLPLSNANYMRSDITAHRQGRWSVLGTWQMRMRIFYMEWRFYYYQSWKHSDSALVHNTLF